jgi:hypothetical protein
MAYRVVAIARSEAATDAEQGPGELWEAIEVPAGTQDRAAVQAKLRRR